MWRSSFRFRLASVALSLSLLVGACAASPSLVDRDPATGFALYRSGQLDARQLAELCRLGVEEMVILDGGAATHECSSRARACPGLRIRYDVAQHARRPVSAGFLVSFDAWVEEARRESRKIAFRCRHGWHRTGRLTAWYRMRFQELPAAAAIAEMESVGRFMGRHRQLVPQVQAMADHLAGRPCSTASEHCVGAEPRPAGDRSGFQADVCP